MDFDVVVVGGGHAGIEAARALSQQGKSVAMVTLNAAKVGAMSCNPAIGGVAKSHLVFEIDALGGLMGACADDSAIQARRLNMKKGPAVRSTRVQCDKDHYIQRMSELLSAFPLIKIVEGEVAEIVTEPSISGKKISGIRLKNGVFLRSKAAIITAGTFMKGLMFCGFKTQVGGRIGDKASDTLSDSIKGFGHKTKRLKTGTPARLNGKTINFSNLQRQWGDPERRYFSWRRSEDKRLPQLCCYITHTNLETHKIIEDNFDKSPLFSGEIQGVGPRYCPSIEDKIKRFKDRERHQIFLEPEGLNLDSIYPNGLSTSMPEDVQLKYLRSIVGLEKVEILKPGYAVEYDSFDPLDLHYSLMSKFVDGLFMAGQVNRTSGYEEAAAQGLWAGISARCYLDGLEFEKPMRHRSYIETLVDDLTTFGTEEPYRLFTSRSEYRLHLREDNAYSRMFALANKYGLVCDSQRRNFDLLEEDVQKSKKIFQNKKIRIDKDRVVSLFEYLKRPEVNWETFDLDLEDINCPDLAIELMEIEAKYAGYLKRQEREISGLEKLRKTVLNPDAVLDNIPSLSAEVVEKFKLERPSNFLELSRISGMTPSAMITIAKHAAVGVTHSK